MKTIEDFGATIPTEINQEFRALAQGRCDYVVNVISNHTQVGHFMTICATEEAIYISREQAKAFFGLVEP